MIPRITQKIQQLKTIKINKKKSKLKSNNTINKNAILIVIIHLVQRYIRISTILFIPQSLVELISLFIYDRDRQTITNRTLHILLLGPGDSGKTTIVKQMTKIHETLTDDDIKIMAPYIQDAVVGYMRLLCFQCQELFEKDDEKTKVEEKNEELRLELLSLKLPYDLTPELAAKISRMWADPAIKETLRLRSKFQIHDNVEYFFNKIESISAVDYEPNFEDYLRIRTRSTGFAFNKFVAKIDLNFGEYRLEVTDVAGTRSERKKSMRIAVDDIKVVIYVVAISEYDLKCFEDNDTNRLIEALNLFKEIVNRTGYNKFFNGKQVVIFFNKYDLFKEKIKTIPITVAFPDFPTDKLNPNDEIQVIKFIASKFVQCFDEKNIKLAGPLHIHRISALNTNKIQKVLGDIIFNSAKANLGFLLSIYQQ